MSLESTSFQLMNASAAIYAGAMLGFAYDFAFTSRFTRRDLDEATREPVAVGATAGGAGADATAGAAGAGAAGTDRSVARRSAPADHVDPTTEPTSKAAGIAVAFTVLAFALHTVALLLHSIEVGRVPWGNMYEFSLAAGWTGTAGYLALMLRYRLRWLGLFVTAPVLLTVGLALVVLYPQTGEVLAPNLDSYWLVIHVSAAAVCGGIFAVGTALSLLYVFVERAERRVVAGGQPGRSGFLLSRVPPSAGLDRLAFKVHAFAFPLWTFAVVSGAIWAEEAWGRYWGWDPKETWAFITWVVYAGYLHARVTAGWRGRRAALIAVVGFATYLFNYFGVNLLLPGLHSYSGL